MSPLRSRSPSDLNFDLTAVREKRCSVNGEVSPLRAEIAREIDRNRNQRLQRQASPPCAVPSLEFVTPENKKRSDDGQPPTAPNNYDGNEAGEYYKVHLSHLLNI